MLLAHGKAASVYRLNYASQQGGDVSIALSGDWTEPLTPSKQDHAAAQRRQEFQIGWFADPIFGKNGDYPPSMRRLVGDRLPRFTLAEKEMLANSADYFALNHYTSRYAFFPREGCPSDRTGWLEDQCCNETTIGVDGKPIGPKGGASWFYSVPWGFRKLLVWLKGRYGTVDIAITENGAIDPPGVVLNDTFRARYLTGYLDNVRKAIVYDNVTILGYFVWSLIDNVEWSDGYKSKFGLFHLDDNTMARTPKASVAYLRNEIRGWRENLASMVLR